MASPTPSAEMVDLVRRRTGEVETSTYTLSDIQEYIARYPLVDSEGREPTNDEWSGDWDLNQAVADIWEEKANKFVLDFDFSADGGDYSRSQVHTQMLAMARLYRSRRSTKAVRVTVRPMPDRRWDRERWVGNLPELTDDDIS